MDLSAERSLQVPEKGPVLMNDQAMENCHDRERSSELERQVDRKRRKAQPSHVTE